MSLPTKPQSRVENYLGVIVGQETAVLPQSPQSRVEDYLDYIAKNGAKGSVKNAYFFNNKMWEDAAHTIEIAPEEGKIYLAENQHKLYVYQDGTYIAISGSNQDGTSVFATYQSMVNYVNYIGREELSVGSNVYILDTGVPDLWVAVAETTSIEYNFVSDEQFIADMKANGYVKVGFYLIAQLESGVDLADYYNKTQTDDKFVSKDELEAKAVLTEAQTLTDTKKAQARENINAAAPDGYYGASGGVMQYATNFVGQITPQNASNVVFRPTASNYSGSGWSADSISGKTATIQKIKGKLLMFNQLIENGNFASGMTGWSVSGGTASVSNGVVTYTTDSDNINQTYIHRSFSSVAGHKYFVAIQLKGQSASQRVRIAVFGTGTEQDQVPISDKWETYAYIGTSPSLTTTGARIQNRTATIGTVLQIRNFICIDLTQMYGAGKEPQTVGEFKAQFPLDYYAYNTGELISLNATGLKTNGYNQWDEEWEVGSIDVSTGQNVPDGYKIRSKNYTPVFNNTDYYWQTPSVGIIYFYDASKNYISNIDYGGVTGSVQFTTPENVRYIRFIMPASYGTTYNHDICINLSWSGIRNGDYEPNWDSTLSLPIATYFGEDGMNGVGTAYDELTKDKAIKRFGKVDLGTLDWFLVSEYSAFQAYITGKLPSSQAGVCGRYDKIDYFPTFLDKDKVYWISDQVSAVVLRDSSATSATGLKASLSGVYLYYELEEPVETPINPPLNLTYRCDDFGTELLLPQNDDEPVTAPMDMDVVYGLDYEANVRNMAVNFPNNSFVYALASAFSTIGYTMKATNDNGNWRVTLTANPPSST